MTFVNFDKLRPTLIFLSQAYTAIASIPDGEISAPTSSVLPVSGHTSDTFSSLLSEPAAAPAAVSLVEEDSAWGYSSYTADLSIESAVANSLSIFSESEHQSGESSGVRLLADVSLDEPAPSDIDKSASLAVPDLEAEFTFGDHFNFDLSIGGSAQ